MSISIVGMGMGDSGTLTARARQAISEAGILIGAERLLRSAPESSAMSRHAAVSAEDIAGIISRNPYQNICILMSGDVGFYSGAKKLAEALQGHDVMLIPGISSVQYFAALMKRPWQDWKLVSAHGKSCDAAGHVRVNRETFFLTGGQLSVQSICRDLSEAGMGHCRVTVGENLGSGDEQVRSGTAEQFSTCVHGELAVMLAENPAPCRLVSCGLSDDVFVRGNIPMTKSEVRSVILSKLQLCDNDIVFDVGAGTGSVSVEAALLARDGHVYAFEREGEGCGLIRENAKKLGVGNLTVVEGSAPEALRGLPAPDAAFIGGSGGSLEDILDYLLSVNPAIRLVVSAVTLETLAQAASAFSRLPLRNVEIVQLAVSRARQLGGHQLMIAQNPIYLFSGAGCHV